MTGKRDGDLHLQSSDVEGLEEAADQRTIFYEGPKIIFRNRPITFLFPPFRMTLRSPSSEIVSVVTVGGLHDGHPYSRLQ